jgi:putative ABC transport system substrate-binding protein
MSAPRTTKIGVITYASGAEATAAVLKAGLALHGYREGENTTYLVREGQRNRDATRRHAQEIVAWGPDLVFSLMTNANIAMKEATAHTRTPVVFWAADAVAAGLVRSYRQPGTNFTGFCNVPHQQLLHVRLLHRIVPGLKRIGHLYNPTYAPAPRARAELVEAGRAFGVEVTTYETLRTEDFETSVRQMHRDGMQAFTIGPHEMFNTNGERLGALAQQYGLPAIGLGPRVLQGGGVAIFVPPFDKGWPAMVGVAARILAGEDPAQIPVERRIMGSMTINVGAAERLGLTIPADVLDEADHLV